MHIYVKIYQHVSGCQQVFGLGKYGENINTICPSFSNLFQLWFTSSVRSGAHWVFLVSAERCGCITTAFEQHEQVYIIYIAPYLHIYLYFYIKVWMQTSFICFSIEYHLKHYRIHLSICFLWISVLLFSLSNLRKTINSTKGPLFI